MLQASFKRPWTTVSVTFFISTQRHKRGHLKVAHDKKPHQNAKTNIVIFSSKTAISYKLCVTEKRTYVNKLKFPIF